MLSQAWSLRLTTALVSGWWWSLTLLGLWIVPSLFIHLPSKSIAGTMAAQLFSHQTWIALGCGIGLLTLGRTQLPGRWAQWLTDHQIQIVGAMLCALLLEFAVSPHIVARDNLALWHKMGTGLFVIQWLLTGWLYWNKPLHKQA
jgi:hypothetical protein